ncbi:molybdopterin-dependent oxidoreductase [Adlercreutzia sp. R25]|uniref:Molybdopterin-dependent oxidoreductase n=1 Tax=Adlercreutzia shanghongiae TaxID=3111773 RepID=A0ABU6IYZ4_9ACTN|nr:MULTISPECIES: molybdopterin-dependent oxidoreductase [unclassified Adlercreutzia]MEC4271810.1 molybdopterin-dependent oxidoreductase [Adlercreutzia sp. R25]MEC4294817.1 molybdopterin-dependent oxidoreductase [Adlercreutzia sp. R22]
MEMTTGGTGSLSRRAFVGAAAAATAIMAAGCAPESKLAGTGDTEPRNYQVDAEFDENQPGEWKPVPCWLLCGGRCQLKAYVVDGVVTRVKTDDNREDTLEEFQNRACPRGRSQRKHVFAADRIKYPMKRKSWNPGGTEVNGELRGVDEWERISWDEALDITASEMKRIYDAYGPEACFYSGISFCLFPQKVLPLMGGYSNFAGCTSYGHWMLCSGDLGISTEAGEPGVMGANDRLDMLKAETIVLHGLNPAWSSGGSPAFHFWRAKEAGAEFIFIGPEYNVSASMLDARWIPCRPNTDVAFLLAVAYEMLRLDKEKGDIVDWDFIDRCTVGFDKDRLPADARSEENIYDYLMGNIDGVAKTPEWASAICGTPVEDITWYAEKIGKNHAVTTLYAWATGRNTAGESMPQAALTVGCLGGHFGKPGHATNPTEIYYAGNEGNKLVSAGAMRDVAVSEAVAGNPAENGSTVAIPLASLWKDINKGSYTDIGNCDWVNCTTAGMKEPEEKPVNIKMIMSQCSQFLTTMVDVNEGIKAFRSAEFVLSMSQHFTTSSQYADIVLPSTTPWEGPGYDQSFLQLTYNFANRETMYFASWAVAPLFEARSDRDICHDLLDRLGFNGDDVFPYSEEQREFDRINGATFIDEDGVTSRPLVTITQEKLDELGLDGTVQEGVIDYDELVKRGLYHVPRSEGDNRGYIAYADFVADPEANPRPFSTSGKFELYCQTKADGYNRMGIYKEEIKPYACYRVGEGCYQDSFTDFEGGVKGEFPLQLYTPHYLRRAHAGFDSVGWLRQAFENPVYMNPLDAADRGVSDGDWVLVRSKAGGVLRQVSTMETLMPGVVGIPHGSWQEMDPETGYSKSGCENVLCPTSYESGLMNGYNSTLVEIERYEDQDLLADKDRPVVLPAGIEE